MRRREVIAGVAAVLLGPTVESATLTYLVGDDDGFGGTQPNNPAIPGSAYVNFASPLVAPGVHQDEAGLDRSTIAPWTPYTFIYHFTADLSNLSCAQSAVFEIQTGSLARRPDGSGYGYADVSVTIGQTTWALGDLLAVSTGAAASAAEESVRLIAFDLLPLLDPLLGTGEVDLEVTIDGSALAAPVDQFAIDFARLTIVGSPLDPLCIADLTCDGEVDGADLGLLLGAWGTRGPGDLNGDGTVDGADLGLLLGAWGDCPR